MILCDTNILIEFYNGNAPITKELERIGLPEMGISVITAAELFFGARNKREMTQIRNHLALLTQLPLNEAISATFIELIEEFALSHRLSVPDALIAATAAHHNLQLYTLNVKDFHFIPGISLYQP